MRFLLLILLFFSCSNDPLLVEEFVFSEDLPVEELKDVEILYSEYGNIKVKINASNVQRFNSKQPLLVFSNNVKVTFYNDSLKIQSILTSHSAIIDKRKNIMKALGMVVLENNINEKLETEELIWNEESDLIYTEEPVKITTKKEILFGEGFVSSPDLSSYSISNIRGTFDIQSSQEK